MFPTLLAETRKVFINFTSLGRKSEMYQHFSCKVKNCFECLFINICFYLSYCTSISRYRRNHWEWKVPPSYRMLSTVPDMIVKQTHLEDTPIQCCTWVTRTTFVINCNKSINIFHFYFPEFFHSNIFAETQERHCEKSLYTNRYFTSDVAETYFLSLSMP